MNMTVKEADSQSGSGVLAEDGWKPQLMVNSVSTWAWNTKASCTYKHASVSFSAGALASVEVEGLEN